MTIFRRCPNCKQLFKGKKCGPCSARFDKARQKNIEGLAVYRKSRWRQCRRDARLRWLDYDIWLLGLGRAVVLEHPVVHHIIERDERPDLCYDLDNLITVSRESHGEIHELYKTDRQAALRRISAGMARFKEMFSG